MHWILSTLLSLLVIGIVYRHIGWTRIRSCYQRWFTAGYWDRFNTVEAISWIAKIMVIIPGLVFHVHIWQLYWFTLISSLLLIWVSEHKILPTLVAFNTVWVWLSISVLAYHYMA